MSLSQLYQSKILEHNRAPQNHLELPDATHSARGLDALCGDDIQVWLKLGDSRIRAASWTGEACAITTASASMLTDWLVGRRVDEIEPALRRFEALLDDESAPDAPALGDINSLRAVGRYPSRRRNALMPWRTALDALDSRRA